MKEMKRRECEAEREKIQEKEKKKHKVDTAIKFTPQEIELFTRRHENDYDLTIDSMYMLLLNSFTQTKLRGFVQRTQWRAQ